MQRQDSGKKFKHPFPSPVASGLSATAHAKLFPRDHGPFDIKGLAGGLSDLTLKRGKFRDHLIQINEAASQFSGSHRDLIESSLWREGLKTYFERDPYAPNQTLMSARGGSHINADSKSNMVYCFRAIYYRSYADIGARLIYV